MHGLPVNLFVLLVLAAARMEAAELNSDTGTAWAKEIASARAQLQLRVRPNECFLWAEDDADRWQRVRRGEIVVAPGDDQNPKRVPGGLIHHWVGAVFIPGVSLAEAVAGIRDYGRYTEYRPGMVSSALTSRDGAIDRFSTVERHRAMFSKIGLAADFTAEYRDAGEKRGYSVSRTTRMQQIQNFGSPRQYEMEPYAPKAYLWRLTTITRYEEREGGVYLEIEAFGLSRDIPASLHWLVDPFIRREAASELAETLTETRLAVLAQNQEAAARITTLQIH